MTSSGRLPGAAWALVAFGTLEGLALAALAWWPGASLPWPGLALFGAAFGVYLAAAASLSKWGGSARVVWGGAAVLRLLRVSGRPFYDALRTKLGWRGRPDYRTEPPPG